MTATCSARERASSWSCVTRSAVVPWSRSTRCTSARTLERRPASNEENGSSSRTMPGRMARGRARGTPRCWAAESWGGARLPKPAHPDHLEQLVEVSGGTLLAGNAEGHVPEDGQVGKERTLLRDIADASP